MMQGIKVYGHYIALTWETMQTPFSSQVVALISATNFSSYIIELLQLLDTIQIKWNYARTHNNIAIRCHLMI